MKWSDQRSIRGLKKRTNSPSIIEPMSLPFARLQIAQANPLAERLERLMNALARIQTRPVHAVVFGACVLFSGGLVGKWLVRLLGRRPGQRDAREDALAISLLFCWR